MKPVVHYTPDEYDQIVVGACARVFPVDHPYCTNKGRACTTPVISHDRETGVFETRGDA